MRWFHRESDYWKYQEIHFSNLSDDHNQDEKGDCVTLGDRIADCMNRDNGKYRCGHDDVGESILANKIVKLEGENRNVR